MRAIKRTSPERRGEHGGVIAEFGPAVWILLIFIILPLVCLFSFLDGFATITLAVNAAARAAGPATTRSQAITNMQATGNQIISGPFGAFANLTPRDASALTITVLRVAQDNSNSTNFSGTAAIPTDGSGRIDSTNFFYEYQVTGNYKINPIFFPSLFPNTMQFTSSSHCEHPDGLND